MIGKVQDMLTSAIIVGAVEKTDDYAAVSSQNANADTAAADALDAASADDQVNANENAQNADQEDQQKNDDQKMDEKSVSYMTEELNKLMSRINADLEFQYHKEVNTMSVKMMDRKTGKLLKEVPPEEMIQHMIKAKDWLGAFLDKNA